MKTLQTQLDSKSLLIEKQKKQILDYKSDNLSKLRDKITTMVEEKVKAEIELEEKNKSIRELQQRIITLKKEIEESDELNMKRDGQITSLINKIKSQEHEIKDLRGEVNKKSNAMTSLQGEVTELRPSKDAMAVLEKQNKKIEELKKKVYSKESEITVLKNLIRSIQIQYTASPDMGRSPKRLPAISSSRAGVSSKLSLVSNSGSVHHSLAFKDFSGETEESFINYQERLIEKENENEELREQLRSITEVKNRKDEAYAEIQERNMMKNEEKLMKKVLKAEAELKKLEEENIKVVQNLKKGKGKAQGKSPAKVGAKKK